VSVLQRAEGDWPLASLVCQVLWNFCVDAVHIDGWLGPAHTSTLLGTLVDYLGNQWIYCTTQILKYGTLIVTFQLEADAIESTSNIISLLNLSHKCNSYCNSFPSKGKVYVQNQLSFHLFIYFYISFSGDKQRPFKCILYPYLSRWYLLKFL